MNGLRKLILEEAEILKDLHGYSFVVSSKIEPSYYRIKKDGTVIRCLTRLIAMSKTVNNTADAISVNEVAAFVPQQNKRPELFDPNNKKPMQKEDIADDDVDYELLREEFSNYEMSDGQTINIKTVVGQIVKFNRYTLNGDPIYNVTPTPIVRIRQNKNQN